MPSHFTELTMLPATLVNDVKKNKRGLIDGIGKLSHFLFGLATEEEVTAIREGLEAARRQVGTIYHNQKCLLIVVNRTRGYEEENRDDILILRQELQNRTGIIFINCVESKVCLVVNSGKY